jgi:hypothetical protein
MPAFAGMTHDGERACVIVSPLTREFKERSRCLPSCSPRSTREAGRTAGHRRACVLVAYCSATAVNGQPLGAPRSSSEAMAPPETPRTLFRASYRRLSPVAQMRCGQQSAPHPTAHALQRRRANWRPPGLVRYPGAVVRAYRECASEIGPSLPRHPGRRVPRPERQTVCSSRPHGRGMDA